ncbi:PfkB family carbohydrate kinase [Pseudonocardia sp. KRD291]|uniref:PfkB family carbohydrate kinase n=1 Tax=Pseudonocardia sp. KRD291 TaxID=2792007 RepID=UPI001C4A33B9|nr:PfkB family carbohydrate kinase [Pseudonocardia sp. KRD291]MBW0101336.1 bifunctional hydroxymethylpyrimidine kinase/phosphomethylpyrimidine kinase [Pseudonocardia sp. KRD291]
MSRRPDVVVAGQLARDLVIGVEELPPVGGGATVARRREMLGGKGANCAVGAAQLGARVALLAVAGDDGVGDELLTRARDDGIDVGVVVRRRDTATGLIVEILERDGGRRYLEDLQEPVLLDVPDVDAAAPRLRDASTVVLQAQQPGPALLAAARHARAGGARVVLDGAPAERERAELLRHVDVLRADAPEAELLGGGPVRGRGEDAVAEVTALARSLHEAGPDTVLLGVEGAGNVALRAGGEEFLPLADVDVLDPTGAGDAMTAALAVALDEGADPADAVRRAVDAAASTVQRAGGRPDLRGI